jgi:hypothetical protein
VPRAGIVEHRKLRIEGRNETFEQLAVEMDIPARVPDAPVGIDPAPTLSGRPSDRGDRLRLRQGIRSAIGPPSF